MTLKLLLPLIAASLLLSQPAKHATHIDSAKLDAAYPKHSVLLDHGAYRVMAIGREKPGEAEVHEKDTDVLYFVDGTATLITGGTLKNGKSSAPGEIRGTGVDGGESRNLKAGDVVTIPNGMPHHFIDITAPCRYYLVKVRTNDAGKPSILKPISTGPLTSGDSYKVSASHRDKDGVTEEHARDSDIMYFIKGTATIVTGGKVPDGKSTAPEEIRGTKIVGGVSQALKPGDVIVVPNTVPHQFVDVHGPLDYFVIKVRSAQ